MKAFEFDVWETFPLEWRWELNGWGGTTSGEGAATTWVGMLDLWSAN